jgi:hypothetical protein
VIARVAALVAGAMIVTACGGDGDGDGNDGPLRPRLDQIAPAVEAVEAELGGPQQYFEIKAEPQQVQLFVAAENATEVVPYVFIGGELAALGEPTGASGGTFMADALELDPDTVFGQIDADLDEPDIIELSIAGDRGGSGAVEYLAVVQSEEGGTLDVVLGPDGAVRSVAPSG